MDGVASFVKAGHILDDAKRTLDEGLAHIVEARDEPKDD